MKILILVVALILPLSGAYASLENRVEDLVACNSIVFDTSSLDYFRPMYSMGETTTSSPLASSSGVFIEYDYSEQAPLIATLSSDTGTFIVNHSGSLFYVPHSGDSTLGGIEAADLLEKKIRNVIESHKTFYQLAASEPNAFLAEILESCSNGGELLRETIQSLR